jgi:phosphatidylserine decarboxylase
MVLLLSRKMVRIHKEGKSFITVLLIVLIIINVSIVLTGLSLFILSCSISVFVFLFFLQFFRDPQIKKNLDNNKVISPANGKVVFIGESEEGEYFKEKKLQISIFMSPFDVHINRHPISGEIKYYKYHKGKYLVAWHPKSSTKNERTTTVIENRKIKILVRQIAGLVARRIINYSKVGSKVDQASQLGFIKFGSRADIFLPLDFKSSINVGQKTIAGVTELGKLN